MSELVAPWGFVDERVFLTKGGDLGLVLSVRGVDFECLDHSEIDAAARRFEAAVRTLGESFRLYQYILKRDHAEIPHGEYAAPVLRQAIDNRIAYLRNKAEELYSVEIYFVVLYEGWRDGVAQGQWRRLLSGTREALGALLWTGRRVGLMAGEIERARQILAGKVDAFVVQLRDSLPLQPLAKTEAFRFLHRLLNYAPHKSAARLHGDALLDYQLCDSHLECHRDHMRLDDQFVQVASLKEPPAHTFAHMLRDLHELPANFILASEWKREDSLTIRRQIRSKRRHFHNSKIAVVNYVQDAPREREMLVDDGAEAVVADLGGCLREMEVNGNYFGRFSMTLVLYGENRDRVRRAVAEAYKVFATYDAAVIEERYNLLNAWLAVIPGNYAYNLRHLWILNTNHADLSFLWNLHTGEPVNPHLSAEYLAVLETNHAQPFFLNLHYQDIAHSLIMGATGSGKSFFLNFLLTNAQKYDPLTYIFDLGGSYESLTQLFGGSYVPVGIERRGFSINPFCLPPTRDNLHFLASFVRVLIESGGYRMTGEEQRDLFNQVENLYEIEAGQRTLFTLSAILTKHMSSQLLRWVRGGQYGDLFDNEADTLTFARFQTFDFEGMDKYPQVLEPLLFYILHRANAAIYDSAAATTFKLFVMDEAWRFFRNATIRTYILEAVKTWRKRNAAMILATQSGDDLAQSELLPVLVESCATKMFLANPGMDRDAYRSTFHLNETEADMIARLIPKKQILIKRPDLAKVVNLNVDNVGYWLYTNSPYDNAKRRRAFAEHGFERGLEILSQGA
jgi:type IV secretion system protein VirB4